MDLGIKGKVAIVAASSKGLGFYSALALANEGAKIIISGRREDELSKALEQLRQVTSDVESFACDVTLPESPQHIYDLAIDRFGQVDIVIANAGGPASGKALEVSDQDIADAVNANFISSVRLVRQAVPGMLKMGWGRILCIASSSIHQAIPTLPLSNAARIALWGWVKVAARELAGTGVTLNLISPGTHRTDRMKYLLKPGEPPSFPMGEPSDFGSISAFLCSQQANYINGSSVVVDGGASLAL